MVNSLEKFVSVIIPVLNNFEGLSKTLVALDNQTYPQELYEVIVVDNGSKESLAELISQFQQVIITRENRPGSYAARNRGIAIAKGEILAFTDSDCIPNSNWLANGVKSLLSEPNCGLVAGKINFFYQNPQKPTAVELYDSLSFMDQKKYIQQHQYGVTANLFTRQTVFDRVGTFNTNLKSGGDKEWGKRVFQHGYFQVYAENACVEHPARSSFQEISKKITRIRKGGYDIDSLDADNRFELNYHRLRKIIWRLKPPSKSAFDKLYRLESSINIKQKFEFIIVIFILHYFGVWSEIKFYFNKDKTTFI